ncbi:hypothetical protein F2P81_015819 [Scophthalmus maximus]|uniref:Uncharacterized protein n=1 Tax=Scophthalmus maximus TaxID=52904 RepID=A0A6A4SJT8_SCOMX|nr:hypothetical protein F2P81_015819 [Scophthalmus maximus]
MANALKYGSSSARRRQNTEVLLKAAVYKGLVNHIMLNRAAAREPAVFRCHSLEESLMQLLLNQTCSSHFNLRSSAFTLEFDSAIVARRTNDNDTILPDPSLFTIRIIEKFKENEVKVHRCS